MAKRGEKAKDKMSCRACSSYTFWPAANDESSTFFPSWIARRYTLSSRRGGAWMYTAIKRNIQSTRKAHQRGEKASEFGGHQPDWFFSIGCPHTPRLHGRDTSCRKAPARSSPLPSPKAKLPRDQGSPLESFFSVARLFPGPVNPASHLLRPDPAGAAEACLYLGRQLSGTGCVHHVWLAIPAPPFWAVQLDGARREMWMAMGERRPCARQRRQPWHAESPPTWQGIDTRKTTA